MAEGYYGYFFHRCATKVSTHRCVSYRHSAQGGRRCMHWAVKVYNCTGRTIGDITHRAILICIGICAVPIGRINAPVCKIIETHLCKVSHKHTKIYNWYWYLCGAHRLYKCTGAYRYIKSLMRTITQKHRDL